MVTYLCKPVVGISPIKDWKDNRRQHDRASNGPQSQFPSAFLLSRPRIHLHHQENNIEGRNNIEYLEEVIPDISPSTCSKQIKIASDKDRGIEYLREKGDT